MAPLEGDTQAHPVAAILGHPVVVILALLEVATPDHLEEDDLRLQDLPAEAPAATVLQAEDRQEEDPLDRRDGKEVSVDGITTSTCPPSWYHGWSRRLNRMTFPNGMDAVQPPSNGFQTYKKSRG